MEIGKAIFNILTNNANVTAIVGTRVFPNVAAQTTQFPFIIYNVAKADPSNTKDGVSTLDVISCMISCYSESYSSCTDLSKKVRIALDRLSGTFASEQIQSIEFTDYNDVFDDTSGDSGIYRKALDFNIRQINPTQ
tara:strand:- start:6204 stop:6611 length:408 start_codon:yes stop_codon:yes gene_type:complete